MADVRLSGNDGGEEVCDFAGNVFHVGVLDGDKLAGDLLESGAVGSPVASVSGVNRDDDIRVRPFKRPLYVDGRFVVVDDHFSNAVDLRERPSRVGL